MRSAHTLLIVGLTAGLAYGLESVCGPPVTITVTVGAPTVQESVLAEPTATLSSTSFLTSTKFIIASSQSASQSAQPSSALNGPYSFAEENGSTIWLGGKTPTSGAALITNTLVVTLQPQPSSTETVSFTTSSGTILTSADQTTTSWTTLSSTSFSTHYLTNVVPISKSSAYPGNNGWNATLTALQSLPASPLVTASPSDALKRVHPRQVGALVTATINGVVVTWTNLVSGLDRETKADISQRNPDKSSHEHARFDDLPKFSRDGNNTDTPPIFNPYRKLYFNGGFGYAPPPDDPFSPISPPQLAVYNYSSDPSTSPSINAGLQLHGELGAGPRVQDDAYWINAYSAWIGCVNGGPTECRVELVGLDAFGSTIATQTVLLSPCVGLVNCTLDRVLFSLDFRKMAGLQILAYVYDTPVTFYMDDLSLGWSNNTCAAQLERSSSP
ncbi:MAG: hypothetical protein Q9168_006232 [Polycauliona sp. 1 TL-2023]